MIIRKLFKFEGAHIVRNCISNRCKFSIHGHSYKVEVLIESNFLDNGQMVMDFGLLKNNIRDIIDSFDHTIVLWGEDNTEYIDDMKKHSKRWIILPISPSAEQFARVFFILVQKIIEKSIFTNNEFGIKVNSVIVHETDTGYAQAFAEDIYNEQMGLIDLNSIKFSDDIRSDWKDNKLFEKLL